MQIVTAPNIGDIMGTHGWQFVDPWVNYDRLGFRRKREIVLDAAADEEFLAGLRADNRYTVKSAAKKPNGYLVNIAAIVIINNIRRLAAAAGAYNEWPNISYSVVNSPSHPRPLYALLRPFAGNGVIPVVITIENPDRERVQTQHATVLLKGKPVTLKEYWPKKPSNREFPAVEISEYT